MIGNSIPAKTMTGENTGAIKNEHSALESL